MRLGFEWHGEVRCDCHCNAEIAWGTAVWCGGTMRCYAGRFTILRARYDCNRYDKRDLRLRGTIAMATATTAAATVGAVRSGCVAPVVRRGVSAVHTHFLLFFTKLQPLTSHT